MRPIEPVRLAGAVVDVVVPSGPGRLAGVSMAGFHGRAENRVELQVVPYPALTVIFDFGDTVFVDEISGKSKRGNVVVGMAPGRLRGSGRDVDLLQIRLSPVAAHAVLGVSSELDGTVVALDDLWGRNGPRAQDQLHTARSWEDRFAAVALRRQCWPS